MIFAFLVLAKEGDAYPVGALPIGTLINNLESHPGKGAQYIRAAGQYQTEVRNRLLRGKPGQDSQNPEQFEISSSPLVLQYRGKLKKNHAYGCLT